MTKQSYFFLWTICSMVACPLAAQTNQVPAVSIIKAEILAGGPPNVISVQYSVLDADDAAVEVRIALSDTRGRSYAYAPTGILTSGDVGFPVSPNGLKSATITLPAPPTAPLTVRIIALDRQPLDIAALVAQVDSAKLRARLSFIEGTRFRTGAGAAHLAEVQDSIRRHYAAYRLPLEEHTFPMGSYTARNLIGHQYGMGKAEQSVIVDGHYDSVANGPGADDNGTGTVGYMEIASILAAYPSEKSLRYIGFDVEEAGLLGSTAYVGSLPSSETVAGVFNFEMIGYYSQQPNSQQLPTGFNLLFPAAAAAVAQDSFRGNFITNVGNTASQTLIDLFRTSAATYVPSLKVVDVAVPGNGTIAPDLRRSDHAPFWSANKPALMITDGANFRNPNYHTPNDRATDLNFGFMRDVVRATIAAVAQLAEVQHGAWTAAEVANPSLSQEDVTAGACTPRIWKESTDLVIQWPDAACANRLMDGRLDLYTEDGRLFFSKKIENTAENALRTEILGMTSQGVYFLRATTAEGKYLWSGAVR